MLASLWIGGMLPILDQIVSSGKADFIPARNLVHTNEVKQGRANWREIF